MRRHPGEQSRLCIFACCSSALSSKVEAQQSPTVLTPFCKQSRLVGRGGPPRPPQRRSPATTLLLLLTDAPSAPQPTLPCPRHIGLGWTG